MSVQRRNVCRCEWVKKSILIWIFHIWSVSNPTRSNWKKRKSDKQQKVSLNSFVCCVLRFFHRVLFFFVGVVHLCYKNDQSYRNPNKFDDFIVLLIERKLWLKRLWSPKTMGDLDISASSHRFFSQNAEVSRFGRSLRKKHKYSNHIQNSIFASDFLNSTITGSIFKPIPFARYLTKHWEKINLNKKILFTALN